MFSVESFKARKFVSREYFLRNFATSNFATGNFAGIYKKLQGNFPSLIIVIQTSVALKNSQTFLFRSLHSPLGQPIAT